MYCMKQQPASGAAALTNMKLGQTPGELLLKAAIPLGLWALAHPAGWGVVKPGVLHPAERTLLHAPRSVEQGPLR